MAKAKTSMPHAVMQLSAEQKSEATGYFSDNFDHSERGAPRWAKLRAMASIAGQVIKELKSELAALNRKVWIDKATAKRREVLNDPKAVLTMDEYEALKKVANADFSRGMRDPNAKPKARTAQTSKETGAESSKPGANGEQGVPHAVMLADALKRLTVRAKSIQAEMVQFQTSVRVPANGKPLLGDMAEQIVKLVEELNETSAILA